MGDKELKKYLKQVLKEEMEPKRLEQTINICTCLMRKQEIKKTEQRIDFFQYLSEIFRFEGIPIFTLQSVMLLIVCLVISGLSDAPQKIPAFMPLFVLAVIPVLFKGQAYGMSEIEASTRASNAQIILAKLILAGAANLVCITVVLSMEVCMQNSADGLGQMILYCLVPYLVSMTFLLRFVRWQRRKGTAVCVMGILGFCIGWGMSASMLPWLYEASAVGIWIIAFFVFSLFFIKEVCFIVKMRKEGKMYGIIA